MTSRALLGFGLDAQYVDRYPGTLGGLVDRFRHRLSHLSIVSLADQRAAEDFATGVARGLPVVHHLSGVAPANPDGPNAERLERLDSISSILGARWNCEDIGIWSIGPYAIPYFAPPPFEIDTAELVADRITVIMARTGIPFLAEVPSCSFVAGSLSLGEFFHRLVERSGCGVLLDVSHVFSYSLLCGALPGDVLYSLPLDAVRECHIAGGRINPSFPHRYIDSHSDPILAQVESLLAEAARACTNLECVTYEIGVGLTEALIGSEIDRIEMVLRDAGFAATIGEARRRTRSQSADGTLP